MRFFLVISIIVILIGLLFVSLDNMADYGVSSLILAGISSFSLYRIFKYLLEGSRPKCGGEASDRSSDTPSPLDYLIFGDISQEQESDDWWE